MVCAERKWGVTAILKIISRIRAANVPYVCPYSRRRPNENSSRATAGVGGGEEGTVSSLIFLIEHLASGICYSRILRRGGTRPVPLHRYPVPSRPSPRPG